MEALLRFLFYIKIGFIFFKEKSMKYVKRVCVMLFVLATVALVGCNTMAGAGEDLQAGGKALTKSADANK